MDLLLIFLRYLLNIPVTFYDTLKCLRSYDKFSRERNFKIIFLINIEVKTKTKQITLPVTALKYEV